MRSRSAAAFLATVVISMAAASGCLLEAAESSRDLHIDIQDCTLYPPNPNPGACYCLGCSGVPANSNSCTYHDFLPVEIKNLEGEVIGDVTLYYSASFDCGAVWATTRGYRGPTVRMASFIFSSPDANAELLQNPSGVLNINSTGAASEWSAGMQAALPGVVACGWVEYPDDDGVVRQFGACTAGDGRYINHPPVCSGMTIDPGVIFVSDGRGHSSQYMDIQGIYDPDGDDFEVRIDSIFQNQEVDPHGQGSGRTCPDANAEEGWVRLERQGLDQVCRKYRVAVSATDSHGDTCDPRGSADVDVPHSNGTFSSGSDSPCANMAEPMQWYPSWHPYDCPQ